MPCLHGAKQERMSQHQTTHPSGVTQNGESVIRCQGGGLAASHAFLLN